TRTENALIKAGKGQTLWNENPHKQCHKDIDARWAKKHDVTHYGYKGHVNADSATKLIVGCNVTSASVHDSQVIVPLLSGYDIGSGRILFADAGYVGAKQSAQIFAAGMIPMICQKAFVGRPLTAEQEEDNHRFSKIRSPRSPRSRPLQKCCAFRKTAAPVVDLRGRRAGFSLPHRVGDGCLLFV
ncbi:MAG: transposase, partial [Sutterella sp.]|nr:transposase [Sutterella sp.]